MSAGKGADSLDDLLLDTNIVSFSMKGDPLFRLYRRHLKRSRLSISVMTVAELYEGAYRARWGPRRLEKLRQELRKYVILHSSNVIARRWGEVRFQRRRQPISAEDAWIAATALAHGLQLVTHNPADFRNIPGLRTISA